MTYNGPRDEAVRLELLASDDLKHHSGATAKALLDEALSIPNDELFKVQAELRSLGSLTDPNCPEVFINTKETQRTDLVYGRWKTTIGEEPIGMVVSGKHYTGWFWSTEDSTRYIQAGRPETTVPRALELFPTGMRFPLPQELTDVTIRMILDSFRK